MKLNFSEEYQGCFVCGKENTQGLKLDFIYDEVSDEVYSLCNFKTYMQGCDSIVHGGFISMLLDEVMAKTCLYKNIEAVTARIDIRFKKPVYVDERVVFRGKILEIRGKKIILSALCIDENGKEYDCNQRQDDPEIRGSEGPFREDERRANHNGRSNQKHRGYPEHLESVTRAVWATTRTDTPPQLPVDGQFPRSQRRYRRRPTRHRPYPWQRSPQQDPTDRRHTCGSADSGSPWPDGHR